MASIGGEMLLKKYGDVLGVAKAYILGQIDCFQDSVSNVCGPVDIMAAEAAIRLEREEGGLRDQFIMAALAGLTDLEGSPYLRAQEAIKTADQCITQRGQL